VACDTFYRHVGEPFREILIVFRAHDTTANTYEWTVGEDERVFKRKEFGLFFNKQGKYKIKLKVSRTANNGTIKFDSLEKLMTIIDVPFMPVAGRYRGFNVSNPDSIFSIFIFASYAHGEGLYPLTHEDTTTGQISGIFHRLFGLFGTNMSFTDNVWPYTRGIYKQNYSFVHNFPFVAGNYKIRNLYGLSSKNYDTLVIDYEKARILVGGDHLNARFTPFVKDKFIGVRY
jgi:hypothetical protein